MQDIQLGLGSQFVLALGPATGSASSTTSIQVLHSLASSLCSLFGLSFSVHRMYDIHHYYAADLIMCSVSMRQLACPSRIASLIALKYACAFVLLFWPSLDSASNTHLANVVKATLRMLRSTGLC